MESKKASNLSPTAKGGPQAAGFTKTPYLLCLRCKRPSINVDANGVDIGLTKSAFGTILPLHCPGCEVEHTEWSSSPAYDPYGKHMSQDLQHLVEEGYRRIVESGAATDEDNALESLEGRTYNLGDLQGGSGVLVEGDADTNSPTAAIVLKTEACVVCGLCGRRVLRIGFDGTVIPLEVSAFGEIIPLTCPECKNAHAEWTPDVMKPA
eukprot:PhF_6_TR3382/c0_g1_i1/m.4834